MADSTSPDTVPPDNSSSNTTMPETPPPYNETETENGKPELALSVSFPSRTKTNTVITITFTITNPTEYTAHNVVIQTNEILQNFGLVSSTHEIVGNAIEIGDVLETTICSLELSASSRPGQIGDSVTLTFKEMDEPLTQEISISVTGGQQ